MKTILYVIVFSLAVLVMTARDEQQQAEWVDIKQQCMDNDYRCPTHYNTIKRDI